MAFFQFIDRIIPYETFLEDLSARIVKMLKTDHDDPEFISQRKAYELFGRRNIERWRRQGKVEIYKRPGKVEYRTASVFCNAPFKTISTFHRQKIKIDARRNKESKPNCGYIR